MQDIKNEANSTVPEWLLVEEEYVPPKDRDGFLQKTTISILAVLSSVKREKEYVNDGKTAPALRIASAVFVIILMSLSQNLMFPIAIITGILVRLAMLSGTQIRQILKSTCSAVFISALILIPAAIMGAWHTFFYITIKVAGSVTLLGILASTMQWNQMTSGLRLFHIPDIMIFTLDITLKYIMLLGDVCFQMLQALKVRMIGRNPQKSKALSGIFGVIFLKSKEMSEEMLQAMECRGFDGKYVILKRKTSWLYNLIYLCALIFVLWLFLKMEGYL
jgi:cobalt/nickel transport system permease protein